MSPPPGRAPKLVVETALHAQGYAVVAGVDEVGRGCLSGPVTVGAVLVGAGQGRPPRGLRDSKLLTPAARRALVPRIQRWVTAWAVADATAAEIDRIGIIAALRLAGHRALASLAAVPDCVLLDGNHDYLTPPGSPRGEFLPVRTEIKADLRCASVAAASVLAKTTRDAYMVRLAADHPEYGWEINKGYATPRHRAALRAIGPSPYHRMSWRLGLDGPDTGEQLELSGWDGDQGQDGDVIVLEDPFAADFEVRFDDARPGSDVEVHA
jgi:ribonuclease HII